MSKSKKLITALLGIGGFGIAGTAAAHPTLSRGGFARVGEIPVVKSDLRVAKTKVPRPEVLRRVIRPASHRDRGHFAKLDLNRDGKIDRREMTIFHMRQIERRFDRMDLDRDGYLSRKEVKAARKPKQANEHRRKMRNADHRKGWKKGKARFGKKQGRRG